MCIEGDGLVEGHKEGDTDNEGRDDDEAAIWAIFSMFRMWVATSHISSVGSRE